MLDNDELDNEALRGQIDFSMAYANELVSTWIKPSLKSALTSHRETDKELEEYMRRPPRLGVGAPIPESASLSRETIRLKGRLTNKSEKKRVREEEDEGKKVDSDDEEESRAGAIKKRAKVDVFGGVVNGAKKNKVEKVILIPQIAPGPSGATGSIGVAKQSETVVQNDERDTFDMSVPSPVSTPHKKRNKRKRIHNESNGLLRTPSPQTSPASRSAKGELPYTPVKVTPSVKDPCSSGHSSASAIDISLLLASSSGLPSPAKTSPITAALKLPLLNLDGPPVIENPVGNDGSPKKKRKRRKKRKSSLTNAATTEGGT